MAITLLLERSVSIWQLLLLWARISRVARYADLAQARRGLPAQRQAQRQEVRPVPNRVVAAVNHWEGRSWEFFQRSLFGGAEAIGNMGEAMVDGAIARFRAFVSDPLTALQGMNPSTFVFFETIRMLRNTGTGLGQSAAKLYIAGSSGDWE